MTNLQASKSWILMISVQLCPSFLKLAFAGCGAVESETEKLAMVNQRHE